MEWFKQTISWFPCRLATSCGNVTICDFKCHLSIAFIQIYHLKGKLLSYNECMHAFCRSPSCPLLNSRREWVMQLICNGGLYFLFFQVSIYSFILPSPTILSYGWARSNPTYKLQGILGSMGHVSLLCRARWRKYATSPDCIQKSRYVDTNQSKDTTNQQLIQERFLESICWTCTTKNKILEDLSSKRLFVMFNIGMHSFSLKWMKNLA